jgi:hypothetical protein
MKKFARVCVFSIVLLSLLACSISVNLTETPPPVPTIAPTPEQFITVYFMDEARFLAATDPYEVGVSRLLPAGIDPIRAVLDAYFAGPTPQEFAQGLRLVTSGFTGVREFTLENGIARIHLAGKCANNGAAYSVASVINKNLSQFPQVTAFKIYDENDSNLDPDSNQSSVPYCLEP